MGPEDRDAASSAGFSTAETRANRAHGVPAALARQAQPELHADQRWRLREALSGHHQLVWRTLRRFGVTAGAADDAAQHVFLTLAARLPALAPGSERAFLVGTCIGVAANYRRRRDRSRETLDGSEPADGEGMSPEELLDWKQRVQALDEALDALSLDHRTVFVLFELEGFSLPEIAETLGIPLGTATSRLRRARSSFEAWVSERQQTGELR